MVDILQPPTGEGEVGGLTQSRPTAFRPAGTWRLAPVQAAYKPPFSPLAPVRFLDSDF